MGTCLPCTHPSLFLLPLSFLSCLSLSAKGYYTTIQSQTLARHCGWYKGEEKLIVFLQGTENLTELRKDRNRIMKKIYMWPTNMDSKILDIKIAILQKNWTQWYAGDYKICPSVPTSPFRDVIWSTFMPQKYPTDQGSPPLTIHCLPLDASQAKGNWSQMECLKFKKKLWTKKMKKWIN